MSRLQELIDKLCPNGVERKPLEECCEVLDRFRKPISKAAREVGEYPYYGANGIQDYVSDYIFEGQFVLVGEDGSVITPYGKPVVNWAEGKIWVNNHAHIIREKEGVLLRFIYHYLQTVDVTAYIHGNIPKFTGGDFKAIGVPVPPLEVQCEIVRVLDSFTLLTDELTDELTARKKQYEYYKHKLFVDSADVKYMKIGEFTNVFSASRVHKDEWTQSGVPFWRSSDLISYFNGVENSRGKAYISYELYEKLSSKSGKICKDDILVTGGGTIGIPYIVPSDEPMYVKDADLLCIKKNDTVITKYLYYYFLSEEFRNYLKTITHDATIAHYTITQIKDTPVPVPSIERQKLIINILDKFELYTKDILKGLPAEIEARKKQYGYYREQLLNFKEIAND